MSDSISLPVPADGAESVDDLVRSLRERTVARYGPRGLALTGGDPLMLELGLVFAEGVRYLLSIPPIHGPASQKEPKGDP